MKLNHFLAAGLTVLVTPLANGFAYNDQDVLLVFRANGYNNIEFNLGGINQFLNKPNGYSVAVTNWSPDIVSSNFSLSNGLAQFAVLASGLVFWGR